MKFTLSWLKEHLETDAELAAIAARLTAIGLEVESINDAGAALKDFIVGEVLSAEKHPNADKLRLCSVATGDGAPLQIVCGAANARAGIKVVLARPGTVIPASGEALKVGSIRGVESRGMMCSARELLLGDHHDGIIELGGEARAGEKATAALSRMGLLSSDPVIDVSITPNRGDAASVYGIARDLAAAGLGALKTPQINAVAGKFPSPKTIALDFDEAHGNACPIFAGRLIRNVKNGSSPTWIQERLKAVGLKPISALVDVTNFIAHDRGRPLHVFDADKLAGNLHARMARMGETLRALDGKTYMPDGETIVIADDAAARGLAGLMGGEDSGVSASTTSVFLESAWFDPARIARAGRTLGILSDARYRFERGVDPKFVVPGLELATALILDWCGGEASDIVVAGSPPETRPAIAFDPGMVETLGGIRVAKGEVIAILTRLGFVVTGTDELAVTPPSWRSDIDGAADLVEEVVRIHGLGEVASVALPRLAAVAKPVLTPAQRRARMIRRALAARGFHECVSFSFVARDRAALFGGGDEARQLTNPIAADLDAMRPSLLPSLLAAASRNAARGHDALQLFELGPTFQSGQPGAQSLQAAGVIARQTPRDWAKSGHAADLYDAKAHVLAALAIAMGGPMTAPVSAGAKDWYHPGRSGTIALGPKILAQFGELHPNILAAYDLKMPVAAFEVMLDAIPDAKSKGKARPLFSPSLYQPITRDFAFVLDRDVAAQSLIKAAQGALKKSPAVSIEAIEVFDVYEGKGVADGQKSLGLSVTLSPREKTLTDAEIDALGKDVVEAVAKATGGSLRV